MQTNANKSKIMTTTLTSDEEHQSLDKHVNVSLNNKSWYELAEESDNESSDTMTVSFNLFFILLQQIFDSIVEIIVHFTVNLAIHMNFFAEIAFSQQNLTFNQKFLFTVQTE